MHKERWHTHRQVETKDHKKEGQRKKQKRVLASDKETPSPKGSLKYQESNLSRSENDSDDGMDGGDQYCIESSGGGTQYTGDKHNLTMLHI
jgi:hypothetical protein